MAHFDNFNRHRKRGRHPAVHRDGLDTPSSTDSLTSSTTNDLIIPVAPTIIGDPFATTTTPSLSLSSSFSTTTSSAPSLSSTTSSSSSSLSSSLSSTTVSTTTTSSSSSVISISTFTPTTSSITPTTTTSTFIQTIINSSSAHSSSVIPSATSSPAAVGGTSSGIIIGGVIAAFLGAAGVLAAAIYFLRKCRGRQDEAFAEEIWNRGDAHRQSAILGDDSEPFRRPFGAPPRPPTMIERHLNNTPSMPPRQPGLPNMYPNNAYGNGYGAANYSENSFSPGQVVSPHSATSFSPGQVVSPHSATSFSPGQVVSPHSANPFFSPYAQEPLGSPVSSTVPEYHDPPRSGGPALPPQALTREPSSGMRQVAAARQNSVTGGPFNPVVSSPDATDPHYTDLSRSSVTPFQAAQYAEITEKLGAPMSPILGAVPEERRAVPFEGPSHSDTSTQGRNTHIESPFVDAAVVQQPIDNPSYELDDEFPLPSPSAFQQARIASLPPTLPEISVAERSFSPVSSLEFPVPLSVHNTPSPFSTEFSDHRGPPPTEASYKSSPLATSSTRAQAEDSVIPRSPNTEFTPNNRPDTVYTLYDEEDAYGGI